MPLGMSGNSITPNCDPASIEAVVVELERVAVHDAGLDLEPLGARPRLEPLEHDGRLVGREHLRAEARRRDAEGPAAGRHVQEPHARTEAGPAEAFVSQLTCAWR